ncbi:hypothetical protein ACUXOR_000998 [Staphylococcus pasteuri]
MKELREILDNEIKIDKKRERKRTMIFKTKFKMS